MRQHLAQTAMALGVNSGNKSFSLTKTQFVSQRTNFFTKYHLVKKKRGPVEQLAPGKDPPNRITAQPIFCLLFVESDAL